MQDVFRLSVEKGFPKQCTLVQLTEMISSGLDGRQKERSELPPLEWVTLELG